MRVISRKALRDFMEIKPIKTEADYDAVLAEIAGLLDTGENSHAFLRESTNRRIPEMTHHTLRHN